jgi:hypothetical protein
VEEELVKGQVSCAVAVLGDGVHADDKTRVAVSQGGKGPKLAGGDIGCGDQIGDLDVTGTSIFDRDEVDFTRRIRAVSPVLATPSITLEECAQTRKFFQRSGIIVRSSDFLPTRWKNPWQV